jgi:hypothetical protein
VREHLGYGPIHKHQQFPGPLVSLPDTGSLDLFLEPLLETFLVPTCQHACWVSWLSRKFVNGQHRMPASRILTAQQRRHARHIDRTFSTSRSILERMILMSAFERAVLQSNLRLVPRSSSFFLKYATAASSARVSTQALAANVMRFSTCDGVPHCISSASAKAWSSTRFQRDLACDGEREPKPSLARSDTAGAVKGCGGTNPANSTMPSPPSNAVVQRGRLGVNLSDPCG